MYKKKQFLKLGKKYSSYQDEGTVGMMMEICHRKLEDNIHLKKLKKNCNRNDWSVQTGIKLHML